MKILKLFFTVLISIAALSACQKELSFDAGGVSIGTLKKDANGACAPITVNGIYKVDSTLNASNYVDVQINATVPGTFDISTDSINGYSFRKLGSVVAGVNTIRLYATGKPIAAGINNFTVKYGTSTCSFQVTVISNNASAAVYTLGGAPGVCTGAVVGGTYVAGVALAPNNTLTVQVNVTAVGFYTIGAATTNGFVFGGSGIFTNTGLQNVVLTGTGTPTAAGITPVTITNLTSTCTFAITVQPSTGGGSAAYTLSGAPNTCTNAVVAGTYTAGTATGAANSVVLNVNVTAIGTYTITTAQANGLIFSTTGTFTNTGAQTVTLTATGTPTAAGPFNYTATGNGTSSCSFSVNVNASGPAAVFTLGACTNMSVAGIYTAGTALPGTNVNSIGVPLNITAVGSYNVTSNTVNGITFSNSGTLSTLGASTLLLNATGTPIAAGTFNFTVTIGGNSCSIAVTVVAGAANVFQCKINGVLNTFLYQAEGTYAQPGSLEISGAKGAVMLGGLYLNVDRTLSGATTVIPGTYTIAASTPTTYGIDVAYADDNASIWSPNQLIPPFDGFTITITSISTTRVVGTFSGTVRENLGIGVATRAITEGIFDLPIN
jgi:hypothetical protein